MTLNVMRPLFQPVTDGIVCLDGVPLPKQLALSRGGVQIKSVLVYEKRIWWFDVRMVNDAFYEWNKWRHLEGRDVATDIDEADALVLACLGHCIDEELAIGQHVLSEFIEQMPQHRLQLSKVESEREAFLDAMVTWYRETPEPDKLPQWFRIKVEQPTTEELRWRDYYCYEIWDEERPIYVGKGKGSRCAAHLEKPDYQWFDQLSIKVFRHATEAGACADELRRVKLIGLENLKNKIMPSGRPSA